MPGISCAHARAAVPFRQRGIRDSDAAGRIPEQRRAARFSFRRHKWPAGANVAQARHAP
jgi:hypothetical protein